MVPPNLITWYHFWTFLSFKQAKYPHAARWYRHIESFEAAGRKQFPAGSGAAPKAAAAGDDDDDVDLFGSDEEDDEEAQKVKEERLQVRFKSLNIYEKCAIFVYRVMNDPFNIRHTLPRRPRSLLSLPKHQCFLTSSPGMTKLPWTSWRSVWSPLWWMG